MMRSTNAGIVSMTDRVLPHLFPTVDEAAFATTLRDAIGIERPPPEAIEPNATSCASLADLGTQGYFQPSTKTRIVVLLTDGECRPFDTAAVASALHGAKLLIVRVWSADVIPEAHRLMILFAMLSGVRAAALDRF